MSPHSGWRPCRVVEDPGPLPGSCQRRRVRIPAPTPKPSSHRILEMDHDPGRAAAAVLAKVTRRGRCRPRLEHPLPGVDMVRHGSPCLARGSGLRLVAAALLLAVMSCAPWASIPPPAPGPLPPTTKVQVWIRGRSIVLREVEHLSRLHPRSAGRAAGAGRLDRGSPRRRRLIPNPAARSRELVWGRLRCRTAGRRRRVDGALACLGRWDLMRVQQRPHGRLPSQPAG